MDEPTDPLARQLALSALTTEQFNLQTARMGTIAEANGRSTLYLGTLSSTVIALAFVGQASQLGDAFYLFALLLPPPAFLLGVFSYLRLVQTAIEDLVYAVGTFRIRQYFLGLDPAAVPFFPPTDPWGMTKLERMGVVATGPLQLLLTAASMVGCINALVGGVAVALAVRSLVDGPVAVATVTGGVVAAGLAALCFGYQVRRFRRAAAVALELYEGQSPGMPDGPSTPTGGKPSRRRVLAPPCVATRAGLSLPSKAAAAAARAPFPVGSIEPAAAPLETTWSVWHATLREMTVRELLAELQRLPRDLEVLAFEAGCEDYCEREVDELELQGGRVYLHLGARRDEPPRR